MMKTLQLIGAAIVLSFNLGGAQAADWHPDKPIEIISGVAAGGALDIMARAMQKGWQDKRAFGVPSTVVNRPGAGSAVAWTYLDQHPGDAHYLSVTSATLLTNSITGSNPLNHNDVTPAQIAFWDTELARLAASGEWKKYLADHQLEGDYRASREAKQFLEAEYAEYKTMLVELGLAK